MVGLLGMARCWEKALRAGLVAGRACSAGRALGTAIEGHTAIGEHPEESYRDGEGPRGQDVRSG